MKQALIRICLACLVALTAGPAAAVDPGKVLIVEKGTHKLHRESTEVTRVAVGNPEIADVNVINRREVLVTGKALGVTSLLVWTKSAPAPREYRIRVGTVRDPLRPPQADPELARAAIDEGRALSGQLPNLIAHRRAAQAAQAPRENAISDSSTVALDTQVLTKIKVAEVSRSTAQQYGLGLGYTRTGSNSTVTLAAPTRSATLLDNAFSLVFGRDLGDNGRIDAVLDLLESRGLARVLAEPSLVAMSGQTATFLAGGEFPVPVSQSGTNSGGISVQYKEFGVRLSLSPTVLARDRIALKLAPEVSDLDFSAGIQVGGVAVPALKVRRTDTTIELGDGETFLISGLVRSDLINSVDKFPGLGDIPILGALFKSSQLDREDRELVMVVTPHLVRPIARGARQPKLPGAEYDRYDPGWARTIFLENGDFAAGFSR
ncbi:type II and III secretion system protein family protein [Fontimonas sp. SYSU GA230001]|uniref:type II and III secretion system protein family protein n=1 Tax=Fontimonas sp. SYSU GA230001 TaxID=3142450 RepID=UPI0032B44F93